MYNMTMFEKFHAGHIYVPTWAPLQAQLGTFTGPLQIWNLSSASG